MWNNIRGRALIVVTSYVLGLLVSSKVIPLDYFDRGTSTVDEALTERMEKLSTKEEPLDSTLDTVMGGNPFEGMTLVMHRNGEVDPCTQSSEEALGSDVYNALHSVIKTFEYQEADKLDKYDTDSFLTAAFALTLFDREACGPVKGPRRSRYTPQKARPNSYNPVAFLNFCDAGEFHTPILPDFHRVVPVYYGDGEFDRALPCHYHTREGLRITSLRQLADIAKSKKEACQNDADQTCKGVPELHLYAVPTGRHFIFAPSHVGEIFDLPHVQVRGGHPVSLEVISLSPRLFDIKNFFDKEESDSIVTKALQEKSETHRIKRSSTGSSGYNVNSRRTSENGFDTHGWASSAVKKRCFHVLGFDEYIESFADGLQVLRYNVTTAYIPHLDWIDDPRHVEEHDFDSAGVGSNRFATILLYMSDMDKKDGGETCFPEAVFDKPYASQKDAIWALRESGDIDALTPGSWEEELMAQCRNSLSIRPNSARAVLFYSQHPNGEADDSALHGACPVLRGEKWAANLWVWNGPRGGYPGAPVNKEVAERNRASGKKQPETFEQIHASFTNTGKDPKFAEADLFFQDTFWGTFSHGDPVLGVNTFEGHQWNVRDKAGNILIEWTIKKGEPSHFSV